MTALSFLNDMFWSPGTPAGSYERMAAAFGHAMIGVIIASMLIATTFRTRALVGAVIAALIYSIFWEAPQILLAGSGVADSAIDAFAVACGALICAAIWDRRAVVVPAATLLLIVLGTMRPKGKDRE